MGIVRLWIDIQGNIIDMWHVKDAIPVNEYDENLSEMTYKIILNPDAIVSEIRNRVFKFKTKDERDEVLTKIKEKLLNAPGNYFVGENDDDLRNEMEQEAAARKKQKEKESQQNKKKNKHDDDGVDYEDDFDLSDIDD